MLIPINQIKEGLKSKTGGRATSGIVNLYSLIQETLFEMQCNVALPSAIRKVPFLSPLVSQPFLRKMPNDMAVEGLIGLHKRRYDLSSPIIRTGNYTAEFMRRYGTGLISIEHIDGEQYLNVRDAFNEMLLVDNCEDPTNGDWQTLGNAFNLKYDTNYKLDGKSSISFDVNVGVGAWGVLKNNFKDIVSLLNKKYFVINFFTPIDLSGGIVFRFGKDAVNYREVTITKDYAQKRIKKGWNILLVDISTATVTGTYNPTTTPSDNDVKYLYFSPNDVLTANVTNFRLDSIFALVDIDYDIEYYSNSLVVDKYGSRRDNGLIASEEDALLLNEKEYILFLRQFSIISGVDIRPASAGSEVNVYGNGLAKIYDRFMLEFPSRKILRSSEY